MKYSRSALSLPFFGIFLAALGCSSGSEPRPQSLGVGSAKLLRAGNCDELLVRIQDDVIAKLDAVTDDYAEAIASSEEVDSRGGRSGGGDIAVGVPSVLPLPEEADVGSLAPVASPTVDVESADDGVVLTSPPPQVSNPDSSFAPTSNGPAPEFSETNNQVEDVQEADIVKTDGETIYLLHGEELFFIDALPASDTSIKTSVPIEGYPHEMLVHDGKALVFFQRLSVAGETRKRCEPM